MSEPAKFTISEKLSEVEREIAMRERLYPHWVQTGKIASARAKRQIDILREIARDYREQLQCKA